MKIKISIIIPVYNVEKYINRCLSSIMNQKYSNLEVIMIDDGSNDNSSNICKKFQMMDSRFHYYWQENSGVSAARNMGISLATGDYISFIDSDDYLDEWCYYKLITILSESPVDIIKYSFIKKLGPIKKNYNFKVPTNKIILKKDYKNLLLDKIFLSNDFSNVWNALIKKDIVKQLKFKKNITLGEDFIFFIECLNLSNSIYFLPDCFYYYIVNPTSITHNKKDFIKKIENVFFVNNNIQMKIEKEYNYKKNYSYVSSFNSLKYSLFDISINNSYKNYCTLLDKIKRIEIIKEFLKNYNDKIPQVLKKLLEKNIFIFYCFKFKNFIKKILINIISKF